MNLCTSCDHDFVGVEAFDAHRVGKHEYTLTEGLRLDPPREDGRRCLHETEMRERGFAVDSCGRWADPRSLRNGSRKGGYSLTEGTVGEMNGVASPEAHRANSRPPGCGAETARAAR